MKYPTKTVLLVIAGLLFSVCARSDDRTRFEQAHLVKRRADGTYTAAQLSEHDLAKDGMLCIRHRNYWCLKSAGWRGEKGKDDRGHAQFDDPLFGARAFARLMYTYRYLHHLKTVNEIIARFAPADDCRGSIGKPPHCPYGVNPVQDYADHIAEALGIKVTDEIALFDEHRKMNLNVAIPLMIAFSNYELPRGYQSDQELIISGIRAACLHPVE
jgi:hypothetical protein